MINLVRDLGFRTFGAGFSPYYRRIRGIYSDLYTRLFPLIAILGFISVTGSVLRSRSTGWTMVYTFHILVYGIIIGARFIDKKERFLSGWLIQILFGINGVVLLATNGMASLATLFFLLSTLSVALFYGSRAGICTAGVYFACFAAIGTGIVRGLISTRQDIATYMTGYQGWLSQGSAFLFVLVYTVILLSVLQKYLFGLVEEIGVREQRYRSLFEAANDAIFIISGSNFIDCNRKTLEMFGCTKEQIVGKSPVRFSPEVQSDGVTSVAKAKEKITTAMAGYPQCFEWRHCRLDGTLFDTEVSLNRIDSGGNSLLLAIVRDVTERKKAEKELRENEAFRKRVFDTSRLPMVIMEYPSHRFIDCNPAAVEIYGLLSREEVLGKIPADVSAEEQYNGVSSTEMATYYIEKAHDEGAVIFEWRHRRPNGEIWDAEVHLMSFSSDGKQLLQFSLIEITNRKEAERKHLEEKAFSDAVLESLPGQFYMYEHGTDLVRWNKNQELQTGYSPEELLHKKPWDFFDRSMKEAVKNGMAMVMKTKAATFEGVQLNKDGSRVPYMYSAVKVTLNGRDYILGTGHNISAIKEAEAVIRESEERFRQIADNIEEVFFLLDRETRKVLYVSSAIKSIFGYSAEQVIGRPLLLAESIHSDDRAVVQFADPSLRYNRPINEEFRILRPDGDVRWLRLRSFLITNETGDVYRVAGVVADITGQKAAQEETRQHQQQLIQADKMASIGMMVSGVAHEINNPNNLIMLNSDVMKTFWKPIRTEFEQVLADRKNVLLAGIPAGRALVKFESLIDGVAGGAVRIKRIVQNLKDFARIDAGDEMEDASLNEIIESSLSVIHPIIKKATDNFQVTLAPDLPRIKGSFQKLEQVIINLVGNACQALDKKTNGVWVSTGYDDGAREITVTVRDEGAGIPAEYQTKIMDPFFTTKRESGGTGLGLSVSYGIIKDHGGKIEFDSVVGTGTTVRVRFPVGNRS